MFKGADIYEDLERRDFTINAMAIPLRDFMATRKVGVVDPLDGLSDLAHKIIRACSELSFIEDPLRSYGRTALLRSSISTLRTRLERS